MWDGKAEGSAPRGGEHRAWDWRLAQLRVAGRAQEAGGVGDSVVAAETPETATSTHLAASLPGLCCPPGPPPVMPVLSPQQGLSCCPGQVSRGAGAKPPGRGEGVELSGGCLRDRSRLVFHVPCSAAAVLNPPPSTIPSDCHCARLQLVTEPPLLWPLLVCESPTSNGCRTLKGKH